MRKSAKPNFLVIGAARAGTTLLHQYLCQHPEIYLPKSKRPEPHFFLKSDQYSKGEDWYHRTYFNDVRNEKAIGEISTSNLYGDKVPERIFQYNPHIKFIVLLRDPVERAFSNYWHSKLNGFEDLPFHEAVINETDRLNALSGEISEIAPFAYSGRSQYINQFNNYLRFFDKNQFLVVLFEDFIENPLVQLKGISRFLTVDESFVFQYINDRPNKSVPDEERPSPATLKYLDNLFCNSNKELAELFNLNLAKWNSQNYLAT